MCEILEFSAVVLAGGESKRLGKPKCLVPLAGKPMILHVIEKIPKYVNEIIIVVSEKEQKASMLSIIKSKAK